MTDNDTTKRDDTRVEQAWRAVLREYVDEERAHTITTVTFGDPRLTVSEPATDDIVDIVEDSLEQSNFEATLPEDINAEEVREQLLGIVNEGVEGERPGPEVVGPVLSDARASSDDRTTTTDDQTTTMSESAGDGQPINQVDRAESGHSEGVAHIGLESSKTDTEIAAASVSTDSEDEPSFADTLEEAEDSDSVFQAESTTTVRNQAPEAGEALGAASKGRGEQTAADPSATSTEHDSVSGEGSVRRDEVDIDIDKALAQLVVRKVEENEDIELDDEESRLIGSVAATAVYQYRIQVRDRFFGHLSEHEKKLAYEWLVDNHIRDDLLSI
jgi:hypothetical protein